MRGDCVPLAKGLRASWRELSRDESKERADVVFVGAGPVGLWTAVQLKLASPQTKVLMLEKYTAYQRSHVLQVDQASYKVTLPCIQKEGILPFCFYSERAESREQRAESRSHAWDCCSN